MNKISFVLILVTTIVLNGCRPIQRLMAVPNEASIELGMVGTTTQALLESDFDIFGIPKKIQQVRLKATIKPFTKQDYKTFKRLKNQRELSFTIPFVDSVAIKPFYVHLEIIDHGELIDAFNHQVNHALRTIVRENYKSQIVTSVDLVLSQENVVKLKAAEGIFLESNVQGIPSLIIKNDINETLIPMSQTLTLSYATMGFCWGLDRYRDPSILSLKDPNDHCSDGLEHKASKLSRTENHLKF